MIDSTERDVDRFLGRLTEDRLDAAIERFGRTASGARWLLHRPRTRPGAHRPGDPNEAARRTSRGTGAGDLRGPGVCRT